MIKYICDICGDSPAEYELKIQHMSRVLAEDTKHMCNKCYNKIFKEKEENEV